MNDGSIVLRFGEFAFDTASGELRTGRRRVRLRPQPAALLQYLLEHAGEVVTREDLWKVLWPDGTFVCFDHGLNSCIKQLRAALSDHRRAPRYLETLPRRGYRLISAVDVETTTGKGTPADFLMDCSVQIVGGRLQVSIELKDSADNTYAWTADSRADLSGVLDCKPSMVSTILETVAHRFRQDAKESSTRRIRRTAVS